MKAVSERVEGWTGVASDLPRKIIVLRPFVFHCFARLFEVLEVGTTKVLVLLYVQPKIEYIFCAFSLQEQARWE
jgi:hypothetical protein